MIEVGNTIYNIIQPQQLLLFDRFVPFDIISIPLKYSFEIKC